MQEKQQETLQKMDTEKQLKVKETGRFDFEKKVFPGLSEGQKSVGAVSKNATEKTILCSCSVNKLNYLEYLPSLVIGISS